MTEFTVETIMEPVVGGDWALLRSVTDLVPGTILLEDPGEPTLIIPVDSDSLRAAALFVQGVMSVLDLKIKWGRAYLADGEDVNKEHRVPSLRDAVAPRVVPVWLEDVAKTARSRELASA